jgi:periplasmic protein TonB
LIKKNCAPEDEGSLPVPAEEFLVTQMPRLKHEVRLPYPPEAKAKNIQGLVVLNVLIDDQGKVRQAELVEGPGYGLNEAALKAIYSFEFSPAVIDKKPVAVRIRYAYRFVLN